MTTTPYSAELITFAEIEAQNLCTNAGLIPMATGVDPRRGAEIILALAERIKNQRQTILMGNRL
jgi:hypothetical protein